VTGDRDGPVTDPTRPRDPTDLGGRAAVVTGGTRGIGRAIAMRLARAGAAVAVLARKPDALDGAVRELRDLGVPALGHAGSAGDPGAVDAVIGRCVAEFGRLDILVCNAATNPVAAPLVELEPAAAAKVLEVNLLGPWHAARAAWAAWMAANGGVILNVASVGGLRPAPFIGMYNVSKAALCHLTRQLALELAPGVRVNALAPGLVKTDMSRVLYERDEPAAAAAVPLGRLGVPADLAEAALFCVSDASAWMTGEVIVVDGGALLR